MESPMHQALKGAEPGPLWKYFSLIASIPRCSGAEAPLRQALGDLAEGRGLTTRQDQVGNLVIVIPAKPGCEAWPKVVLQGHLDMVCEKNAEVDFDFERDGIALRREGEWLMGSGTTLGADNGIALAAALALLDDPPAQHGQLELLFTVDEERGLTGATEIGPEMVEGRLLLNLDSEEEGTVTVGCAGGGDTIVKLPLVRATLPESWIVLEAKVSGASGGHSGLDIVKHRANALRCLGRWLRVIEGQGRGLRLVRLAGGNKRNAIPREASACFALPAYEPGLAAERTALLQQELLAEYGETDPQINLSLRQVAERPTAAFDATTSANAMRLLLALPSGVCAMSRAVVGQVETSTNLGLVEECGEVLSFVCCTRSSLGPALEAVREQLVAVAELAGARAEREPAYPGWAPRIDSPLLAHFKRVHAELIGHEPEVTTIHAGLECGLLGEHFSGMEMISFGPTMCDVHSPDERLSIPSAARFFALLKGLLTSLDKVA